MLLFSQNRQDYYIEIDSLHTFNILSTTVNQDETLTFELDSNSGLEDFLNAQEIYSFEKAYPTALTPRLQRVYIMKMDDDINTNDFSTRQEVKKFFLIEDNLEDVLDMTTTYDLSSTYYPDDFMDYFEDFPNSDLMLIRAPLAWTITKGNPNLIVGISDAGIDPSHEDLQGKVIDIITIQESTHPHGTSVASILAASTDNGKGMSSIGYNTKVVSSIANSTIGLIAGLLELSQYPGMKVINCSWGIPEYSSLKQDLDDIMDEVLDNDILVISSIGNTNNGNYSYPASYNETISVTSVGNRYPIGYHHNLTSPINNQVYGDRSWMDVHLLRPHDPNNNSSHNHNDKVNVSAPGHLVLTATDNYDDYPSGYRVGTGTSMSAPMVTGLAALVFAANPNLTAPQVKEIIQTTADNIYHIPYNQPYVGLLGTGRINAYRAVMTAHCMNPINASDKPFDLMIRNSLNDFGVEPDAESLVYWNSQDIWVRNQQDGTYIFEHQNPEYNPTEPVYVYVRVTNKSCETASGDDQLELYWAKASTALNWPDYWDGTITNSQNHPLGGQVPVTLNIPRLKPGQEAILEFPWMVPNPAHYSNDPDPWHFCLLARIVSDDDPMTTPEVTYIVDNVKNNNNIGWKNTTIVDLVPDLAAVATGGKVGVVNTFNETKTFKLEFFAEPNEKGKPIYEEAEVGVVMDSLLRAAWIAGGSQGSNYASPSASNPRIIATGDNMVLDNITLPAGAYTTMDVNFNFLINELTSKRKFTYHVLLREVASGKVIGGETYIINKLPRPTFTAFAGGDETIEKNDSITLQAADIGEDAVYNWYDPEGNLIHTGTDLTVSPLITQTYKLEVITDIDGHKDYDNITISVNPYKIQSIIPNPASSNVIINYDVEGAVSAYIMLVNQTTSNSDNYILDIEETSVSIDVSSYPSGLYSVVLVVNGEIQSSKNLSINH